MRAFLFCPADCANGYSAIRTIDSATEQNPVTIQENNNEIFDFEGIVTEIQNFFRPNIQQNLQGCQQEEGYDGNQYINEMIDGKVESEMATGYWNILSLSFGGFRKLPK